MMFNFANHQISSKCYPMDQNHSTKLYYKNRRNIHEVTIQSINSIIKIIENSNYSIYYKISSLLENMSILYSLGADFRQSIDDGGLLKNGTLKSDIYLVQIFLALKNLLRFFYILLDFDRQNPASDTRKKLANVTTDCKKIDHKVNYYYQKSYWNQHKYEMMITQKCINMLNEKEANILFLRSKLAKQHVDIYTLENNNKTLLSTIDSLNEEILCLKELYEMKNNDFDAKIRFMCLSKANFSEYKVLYSYFNKYLGKNYGKTIIELQKKVSNMIFQKEYIKVKLEKHFIRLKEREFSIIESLKHWKYLAKINYSKYQIAMQTLFEQNLHIKKLVQQLDDFKLMEDSKENKVANLI